MKKRILGLLVSFLLLFSCLPVGAQYIDVLGTKYEKAVSLLYDLGIMDTVSPDYFEPSQEVKRSDAAKSIAALSGVSATSATMIFSDVPEDHPAFEGIFLANQLGIVSGTGEDVFSPDMPVTMEQTAKMLVALLGYREHAETQGGYPSGYLTQANRLDILKNVSVGGAFTKGEFALMLYNTLFVIPAEKASYGTDSGKYVTEGSNLLARFLHIYEVRGMVTANAVTAVRGTKTRDGEVSIDGEAYIEKPLLSRKIGRKVVAYYQENEEGIKEILSYRDADDAITVTLDAEDILPQTSTSSLVYQRDEDDKPVQVSIASDAVVLYNGAVLSPFTATDLQPGQGTVYATESENGMITLLVVEEYTDFVVESVNTEDEIIYFEPNAQNINAFEYDDHDVFYNVSMKDGTASDLGKCKKGNVLSVMKSRDGVVVTAIISTDSVSGTVTEKTDDAIYINGKAFAFSDSFREAVPQLGTNVSLRLNYRDKIAGVGDTASGRQYAYLVTGAFEGKGLSKSAKLKMLTTENKMEIFTASKDFKINDVMIGGENLLNPESVLNVAQNTQMMKIFMHGIGVIEQLITYELNENGEIASIHTAVDGTGSIERDSNTFTLHYQSDSSMFLAHALRMFDTRYRIPNETIVFTVAESYTGDNDEQYKVLPGSSVEHSSHHPGLKLYDLNIENEAAVMVTKLGMSDDATMYMSQPVLVKEVLTAMTDEGMACEAIKVVGVGGSETVIYNPDEKEAIFSNAAITDSQKDPVCTKGVAPATIPLSKLEPGDIIKYSAIGDNLSSAVVCFRAGYPKEMEKAFDGTVQKWAHGGNDYYNSLWLFTDDVIAVGTNGFRFYATNTAGTLMERTHTFHTATVLIFDKETKNVRAGSKLSLSKGDAIFAARRTTDEQLIVIYK